MTTERLLAEWPLLSIKKPFTKEMNSLPGGWVFLNAFTTRKLPSGYLISVRNGYLRMVWKRWMAQSISAVVTGGGGFLLMASTVNQTISVIIIFRTIRNFLRRM